jgi:hypothetical protein
MELVFRVQIQMFIFISVRRGADRPTGENFFFLAINNHQYTVQEFNTLIHLIH